MRYGWLLLLPVLWAAPAAQALTPTKERPIVVEDMSISLEEIRHWEKVARRGGAGRGALMRRQVVGFLVSYRWLAGEARWRGIVVRAAAVRRAIRRQKRASFRDEGAFRRWLRTTGQTRADIRMRVRMDLLSKRLRRFAVAGATDPREQQARLDEFVAQFREYWVPRTLCSPRYYVETTCAATGEAEPAGSSRWPS